MASNPEYVAFVCAQIQDAGIVTSKKMFGEYMVYVDAKPLLLVCDNTVYVKQHPCLAQLLKDAAVDTPYDGAKPHYILDIDDPALCLQVIALLEPVTPLPKPRKKKTPQQ